MRLQRLTALEADKVRAEHAELVERIEELRTILGDEARIDGLIVDELAEIESRYGDERRTEIAAAEGEFDIEDMIADQQMVISITASGYAKRLPLATYRQQRRGGKGVMGMNLKEGDYIEHLHICSTHDYLLFFTNFGKVYRLKVYELPEGSRDGEGPGAHQCAAAARRGAGDGRDPDARLQGGQVPGVRDGEGPGEEDRVRRSTTPRSAPTGSSRSRSARATSSSRSGSPRGRTTCCWSRSSGPRLPVQEEGGPGDGPRHLGGEGDERGRQGQPRAGARHRPTRGWSCWS